MMEKQVELNVAKNEPARWFAELNLVVMTIFWGSSFAAMKAALEEVSPLGLVAYRFALAAVIFVVIKPSILKQLKSPGFRYGLILAVILYFGYVLQTIALEKTTASRSAFVTALHAAFVPLLYMSFTRKAPRLETICGLLVAVFGLYFMLIKSLSEFSDFNKWDLLTVACAFAWALYIVTLPVFSRKSELSPLIFGQLVGLAGSCWASYLVWESPKLPSMKGFRLIVYLVLFCTLAAVFLQSKYQRYTTSPRAAVIYTMEPVCAATLAFLFLGERLAPREIIGAAMIVSGVLVSEVLGARERSVKSRQCDSSHQ